MTDIADFITARLVEIEEIANRAADGSGRGRWQAVDGQVQAVDGGDIAVAGFAFHDDHQPLLPEHAQHIALHDPETVLAECYAKRRLVEFWSQAYQNPSDANRFAGPDWDRVRANAVWTLRHLALPYANHPDYQTAWRP